MGTWLSPVSGQQLADVAAELDEADKLSMLASMEQTAAAPATAPAAKQAAVEQEKADGLNSANAREAETDGRAVNAEPGRQPSPSDRMCMVGVPGHV